MAEIVTEKAFVTEEKVKSRGVAFLYGIFLASFGLFYGYGIGLFNTFFQFFILTFDITDPVESQKIQQKFNMYFVIGGTFACAFSSLIYGRLGRWRSMMFGFVLEGIVLVLMNFHSIKIYYVARFIFGFVGCFWTFHSAVIMTENLPPSVEKYCGPCFTFMISIGIIYGYAFCTPWFGPRWRGVINSLWVTELIKFGFFCYFRMESPKWMAENGYTVEQIKKNYRYLYKEGVAEELAKKMDKKRKEEKAKSLMEVLTSGEYTLQLGIIFMLNMLNQLTGGGLLEFYSTNIFADAGMASPETLTIILGTMSLLAGIFATFVNPIIGLRNMLLSGIAGQSVFYFLYISGVFLANNKYLIVVGIFGSYFCYCISLGGVLFAYAPKVFPASGITFVALFQWILSCYLTGRGETLRTKYGATTMLFAAQIFATVGSIIFMGYSIDVADKSEEQIKEEFQKKDFFS